MVFQNRCADVLMCKEIIIWMNVAITMLLTRLLEPVLSFEPLEGFLLGLSSVKFEYHSFDKSPGECHQRSGVSSIVDFFAGIRGKERLIDTIEGADYSIAQAALKVCFPNVMRANSSDSCAFRISNVVCDAHVQDSCWPSKHLWQCCCCRLILSLCVRPTKPKTAWIHCHCQPLT